MTMLSASVVAYWLVVKQVPFIVVAMATPDDVTRSLMRPTVVRFLVHVCSPAEYTTGRQFTRYSVLRTLCLFKLHA